MTACCRVPGATTERRGAGCPRTPCTQHATAHAAACAHVWVFPAHGHSPKAPETQCPARGKPCACAHARGRASSRPTAQAGKHREGGGAWPCAPRARPWAQRAVLGPRWPRRGGASTTHVHPGCAVPRGHPVLSPRPRARLPSELCLQQERAHEEGGLWHPQATAEQAWGVSAQPVRLTMSAVLAGIPRPRVQQWSPPPARSVPLGLCRPPGGPCTSPHVAPPDRHWGRAPSHGCNRQGRFPGASRLRG